MDGTGSICGIPAQPTTPVSSGRISVNRVNGVTLDQVVVLPIVRGTGVAMERSRRRSRLRLLKFFPRLRLPLARQPLSFGDLLGRYPTGETVLGCGPSCPLPALECSRRCVNVG